MADYLQTFEISLPPSSTLHLFYVFSMNTEEGKAEVDREEWF